MLSCRVMKCPHCSITIHNAFLDHAPFGENPLPLPNGQMFPQGSWHLRHQQCPECGQTIITLRRTSPQAMGNVASFRAYPSGSSRPIAPEVPEPYRQDFSKACKVLEDSPKASAALSRRNLQAILRDKAGTKTKDLHDQIEEVINSGKLPSHISDDLHAVRNIGNFAAHEIKSKVTGAIVEVESGEAEWNLDVLESLFDFYFVQPALATKRKADLNKKLREAGKPEIP